ncbi:MAG: SpoVA/SpoVAEb family sporulation membrane protein [Oscillospiraceae bacterium]|nr:SpoVA/SpoVAEb family sporulation membrane protein [Oscillospiraceae bacterium]
MNFLMLLKAFAVGGAFCVVGQLLIDNTKLTPARILVGFVVAGAILTSAGVYEPLIEWAGAGASVPLTGFGYALVTGTKEAMADKGAIGILAGGLTGAAGGVGLGIVLAFLAGVLAKPRAKG